MVMIEIKSIEIVNVFYLKCLTKRWVFKRFLKLKMNSVCLVKTGKSIHKNEQYRTFSTFEISLFQRGNISVMQIFGL